jgi:hypothetical protein
MLRRLEAGKPLCSPCPSRASNQETKVISKKRTTIGCSCRRADGSVVKPLQHLAHQEGGGLVLVIVFTLELHHHGGRPLRSGLLPSLSCHERESERETTSRSRAGRSQRAGGHADATTVVLESQPQHTTGMTTPSPVVAGIDAVLLAACQLPNNPPR